MPSYEKDVRRQLLDHGCSLVRQGKGDHEVWRNGSVTVTIVQARTVSPKVVRDALRAIERSTQDD